MKATVLMWLMPQWISYRLVPYLCPPGLTKTSCLARNSHDSIDSRCSGKEHALPTRKSFGNRAYVSFRVLRLLSPILFALGVSQFPCALRDWAVLVLFRRLSSIFVRSRRLSSIVMRFGNSRVLSSTRGFSYALGDSRALLVALINSRVFSLPSSSWFG